MRIVTFLLIGGCMLIPACSTHRPVEGFGNSSPLHAGDRIAVDFISLSGVELRLDLVLDSNGQVNLPYNVHLPLDGRTLFEASQLIVRTFGPDGPTEVSVRRR